MRQHSLFRQKTQHAVRCHFRAFLINTVRRAGIYGEGPGLPHLPVIIQRGRVIRVRLAYHQVGQTEVQAFFIILVPCIYDPHMGNKVSGQIKAGQMDAPFISLQRCKEPVREALGRLPCSIAGKHAVDVRIVQRPEAFAHVHGELSCTGNHHHAAVRSKSSRCFQFRKFTHKARRRVHLLHFVAPDGAHHSQRFFPRAETVPIHRDGLTVRKRIYRK